MVGPKLWQSISEIQPPSASFSAPASIPFSRPPEALACTMDEEQIKRRIVELQTEHRDLDEAIERLSQQPGVDELRLRRLKKRRLMLRDCIARLQMELVPDIPA
jgi:hypothetical protein